MSLSIYTYSNPYEISNEPFWESIKNCAHFCVSQTMVNGMESVYSELKNGQLSTVDYLVQELYPSWFDTNTYIKQYAALTNALKRATFKSGAGDVDKIKQALNFNKTRMLDSIRLLFEMGVVWENIKLRKTSTEQKYLLAAYKMLVQGEDKELFQINHYFTEQQIDQAIVNALEAENSRKHISVDHVDKDTVVIHGVHQFTPTILHCIEQVSKYKRVVLLFNYQTQYKEVYQTWLDVYSCFDIEIKSQFDNEFKPLSLLMTSYEGNVLGDTLGKLANGEFVERNSILSQTQIMEFDNVTEFSAYVAKIYEDAANAFNADSKKRGHSALSYMKEQFYSANNSVNDILKVYFPEQFGERHFLAYPIGHFFVAVTNMWDSENGGIKIENMNDIAECLYSEVLPEENIGELITTFNSTQNYFCRCETLEDIVSSLKALAKQGRKISKGKNPHAEQLKRLEYYTVSDQAINNLISALESLDKITKLFYADFEDSENNFKQFYEKVREFVEQQILPNQDAESEFRDIIIRLLARLEEIESEGIDSSFECLKETMSYYLKQEEQKGQSANWIVRDFQQIDGDVLMSNEIERQEEGIAYHFACVSDTDMNVKREDQFPWPLDIDFFEKAYEPLDWKYQVYVKSRREYKHFKRYALLYGLVFNRCAFKISYVKHQDDKENEIYYLLRLLGIEPQLIDRNMTVYEKPDIKVDSISGNASQFKDLDGFRSRICKYRFALGSVVGNGACYRDRFLQSKYFEVLLTNMARRNLVNQIGSDNIISDALDECIDSIERYFPSIIPSEKMDIKMNVSNYLKRDILKNGQLTNFPDVSSEDVQYMRKREEFLYLHLEDEEKKNVLLGMFNNMTQTQVDNWLSDNALSKYAYEKSVNVWCQWCPEREICLEYYKSPIQQ